MALADVIFEEEDSALGAVLELSDGVTGYVLTGVSNGDIVQGTPFYITSLEAAVALGLANATNPFAYKVIKEHYDQTGTGAEVYVMLVSSAMTVNSMADKTNANGAVKLLDFGGGEIRRLGLMDDPASHSITVTNGLDANVYVAEANAEALAIEYEGTSKQAPIYIAIGGTGFNGTASATTDGTASSNDHVSIVIGDTVSGNSCALGVFLGRKAADPVQRKASRVATGNLVIPGGEAYIGTTLAEKYTSTAMLHDKAFVTFRTFPRKNGYYFAGDMTRTPTTNDFHESSRRLVMNKVRLLSYAVLVEEIDNEIAVEDDGTIDAGYAAYLQGQLDNMVKLTMVDNGELSKFESFIDTNQNILSTNLLNVSLKPTPVGYAKTIKGKLAFVNPASA